MLRSIASSSTRSLLPVAAAVALLSACIDARPPAADTILSNGIVHALVDAPPGASAVAIRMGRIQAVANDQEITRFKGPGTQLVDLHGATVIPGLIATHAQLLGLGEMLLNEASGEGLYIDLSTTESEEDAVQRLRARARALPTGQWILGRGWDEERWVTRELPDKRLLSEIVRYNPVFLVGADGDTVWVNQLALDAAGIDAATPDPTGGRILRQPRSREPSGVLIGTAWAPVLRRVPPLTPEERSGAIVAALDHMASMGFTMIQSTAASGRLGLDDLGAPEDDTAELFRQLALNDRLPIRVGLMIPGPSAAADSLMNDGPQLGIGGGQLDIRTVELVADGALDSRTAALLDPYDDDPSTAGLLRLTHEEITAWVVRGMNSGVQVAVHAVGDAAVRSAAVGFTEALSTRPGFDARPRVEHLSLYTPPDLERLAQIGAIAAIQPSSLIHLMNGRVEELRVGAQRARRMYAFESMRAAGIRLAGASDIQARRWHPLFGLYSALTRQTPEGLPEEGWNPEQRLERREALRLFTLGAAYAAFREHEAGTIEPGKWADLTVLSRDILTIPTAQILEIEVLATYVGGREVYMREPAAAP